MAANGKVVAAVVAECKSLKLLGQLFVTHCKPGKTSSLINFFKKCCCLYSEEGKYLCLLPGPALRTARPDLVVKHCF